MVRGSVEETLNELLEKEAESLTQAARYERSEARQGYRSGHYDRSLTTTSGDVTLHVPRLKGVSFETAIIERYRRRESSVEEALIEMYLAGVSVRRVEDITEALWGSKVSPATISELNKKAYVHIEDWRNRPLQGGHYPYVYVDGIYLRRNWGGEYENVAVLVAIAVNVEEVEQAATLVQQAVHPDALTIFGATFDEELDDEIRVTVIATGFESNDQQEAPAAPAAADTQQPTQDDAAAPAAAPQPLDEAEGEKAEESDVDRSFDEILKIFSRGDKF